MLQWFLSQYEENSNNRAYQGTTIVKIQWLQLFRQLLHYPNISLQVIYEEAFLKNIPKLTVLPHHTHQSQHVKA
jgi:hypothetical protein